MFKKLLIAVCCLFTLTATAQTAQKFGNLNSQEIFALMPETKAAESEMEATSKKYEGELAKMSEEFNNKYQEFIAQQDTLPESIKQRRIQEVQELEQRINNFREVAMQSMQQQQQQLMAPIGKKLTDAIKAIGAENNFTYIFDLANGSILYTGATAEDVTPLVKARLGIK